MNQHSVFISIGSNIGNKRLNCENAIKAIADSKHAIVNQQSEFYKTEPVDYTDQQWFVNAVIQIETPLDPYKLLLLLQDIQLKSGRTEHLIRFGPRVLDLDIILYDNLVLCSEKLVIPHPRMHKRRFVLKPMCDIAPEIIHPILKIDMQKILDELDDKGQGIKEVN